MNDHELIEHFLSWREANKEFLRFLDQQDGDLGTLGEILRTFQETAEIVVANALRKWES